VRFDPGRLPLVLDLPPLTLFERQLIAPVRVYRFTVLLKTGNKNRAPCAYPRARRGHVYMVPNADPLSMRSAFPTPLDDAPEMVQVVLMSATTSVEAIQQALSQSKALVVRGRVVVQWLDHLVRLYRSKGWLALEDGTPPASGSPFLQFNSDAVCAYRALGDAVPSQLCMLLLHLLMNERVHV